jgi:hypothetical protein
MKKIPLSFLMLTLSAAPIAEAFVLETIELIEEVDPELIFEVLNLTTWLAEAIGDTPWTGHAQELMRLLGWMPSGLLDN